MSDDEYTPPVVSDHHITFPNIAFEDGDDAWCSCGKSWPCPDAPPEGMDSDLERVRIAARKENWYAWQKARDRERRRAQAVGCLFVVIASVVLWTLILWFFGLAYDVVAGWFGG